MRISHSSLTNHERECEYLTCHNCLIFCLIFPLNSHTNGESPYILHTIAFCRITTLFFLPQGSSIKKLLTKPKLLRVQPKLSGS